MPTEGTPESGKTKKALDQTKDRLLRYGCRLEVGKRGSNPYRKKVERIEREGFSSIKTWRV